MVPGVADWHVPDRVRNGNTGCSRTVRYIWGLRGRRTTIGDLTDRRYPQPLDPVEPTRPADP